MRTAAFLFAVLLALSALELAGRGAPGHRAGAVARAGVGAEEPRLRGSDARRGQAADPVARDEEEVLELDSDESEDPDAVRWNRRVAITVRSADDGSPVEGAVVRVLVSWRPTEHREVRTNRAGRLVLEACDRDASSGRGRPGSSWGRSSSETTPRPRT